MIRLTDRIRIGNSDDDALGYLMESSVTGVLCVAHDIQGRCGWFNKIEYTQVGLIDGPGNLLCVTITVLR